MTNRENTPLPLHLPPQNRNDLDDEEVTEYEYSGPPVEIFIPFNGRRDDDFTIEIDADGNQTGIIKFYRPKPWELQQSVAVQPEPEPESAQALEPETDGMGPDQPQPVPLTAESHVMRQAEKQRLLDEASIRARVNTPD